MYAVIAKGSKQYKVKKGDVIEVDLLPSDLTGPVDFDKVLFFHDGTHFHIGAPHVEGCVVKGELLGTVKGPKVRGMKYKKRKQEYRTFGHRQHYSQVKVTDIAKI